MLLKNMIKIYLVSVCLFVLGCVPKTGEEGLLNMQKNVELEFDQANNTESGESAPVQEQDISISFGNVESGMTYMHVKNTSKQTLLFDKECICGFDMTCHDKNGAIIYGKFRPEEGLEWSRDRFISVQSGEVVTVKRDLHSSFFFAQVMRLECPILEKLFRFTRKPLTNSFPPSLQYQPTIQMT